MSDSQTASNSGYQSESLLSIQAYSWAIDQEIVDDPTSQLVLMCLAYYAGVDGANAFPSVQRLVRNSRLSERAVRKSLRRLAELGVIQAGNAAVTAAHIARSDRRPKTYNIVLRGAPNAPRNDNGVHQGRSGVHHVPKRGAPRAPDPSSDPSLNHKSVLQTVTKELEARFGIKPKRGGMQ